MGSYRAVDTSWTPATGEVLGMVLGAHGERFGGLHLHPRVDSVAGAGRTCSHSCIPVQTPVLACKGCGELQLPALGVKESFERGQWGWRTDPTEVEPIYDI